MQTYIIFSKISPEAFEGGKNFEQLAAAVSEKIKSECPDVIWKDSYVTMGRFDVIDIVEAENLERVERVSMIIRAIGRAETETLPATPWNEFLKSSL
jgi:uncharacterized protein with GYD domain